MDETLDDLFEIRSVFKDILTNNLSAQPQTHQYAASFAMKYIDYSDALFGCMTERLKTAAPMDRLNLLYTLDTLCSYCKKKRVEEYLVLFRKSLLEIIKLTIPSDDVKAIANLSNVMKIVSNWRHGKLFSAEELRETESFLESIKESSSVLALGDSHQEQKMQFTKQEVMKRIEEDRERSKKIREEQWFRTWSIREGIFNRNAKDDKEFFDAWNNVQDLNDDDRYFFKEEMEKCLLSHTASDAQ